MYGDTTSTGAHVQPAKGGSLNLHADLRESEADSELSTLRRQGTLPASFSSLFVVFFKLETHFSNPCLQSSC